MQRRLPFWLLMVILLMGSVSGCQKSTALNSTTRPTARSTEVGNSASGPSRPDSPVPEAVSFLGQPLFAPQLPPEVLARRERELDEARHTYDRDPHNEQAIVWYGRRLAYLGRFDEAIIVFNNGLAIHPNSVELLRHRGHRFITVRKLDRAIADLSHAAFIAADAPDRVEPDGQPNERNMPRSTLKTNIHYHLGLAQYLKGDYAAAVVSFDMCIRISPNDDMRIAASYWLYLAAARMGDQRRATDAVQLVTTDADIIENKSYFRLMQVFRGEINPGQAYGSGDADVSIDRATIGYGLGMWHALRGEREVASIEFQRVVNSTNWAAFGHIAAEAELARTG